MIKEEILSYIDDNSSEIISLRGYFHENPELSGEEINTSRKIKELLAELDIKFIDVEGTSVLGILDTGREGKTVLIRSDIDALPVEESDYNLKNQKAYVSKKPGMSHACGHDAHMTILIWSLKILDKLKADLKGRIIFVFEEAEENGGGVQNVLQAVADYSIDACWALHVVPMLESGKINVEPGPRMAGVNGINIEVKGQGGHGSRPDLSINPLFCACEIVSSIGIQWATSFGPEEFCTLGITDISGGKASNIIVDKMNIRGTIRYFDEKSGRKGYELIDRISKHLGKAFNCEIENLYPNPTFNRGVYNDEMLSKNTLGLFKEQIPENLEAMNPWFASETYALYQKLAPSIFAFVGIANEEKGILAENHSPFFDIDDEKALPTGILATCLFVYYFLNERI